jgi:hypothetical protein
MAISTKCSLKIIFFIVLVHFKAMCMCILYNFLGCLTFAGTCIFGTTHYKFEKFRAALLYRVPKKVPDQLLFVKQGIMMIPN